MFSQRSQTGAQNGCAYPFFGVNTAGIRFAIIVLGRNGLLQQAAIELIEPFVQARELVQQQLRTCASRWPGWSLFARVRTAAPVKGRFGTPQLNYERLTLQSGSHVPSSRRTPVRGVARIGEFDRSHDSALPAVRAACIGVVSGLNLSAVVILADRAT